MELVIGVLGGMGTYATIHLFQQYARLFPAEKEWDRPRIIIDNRCTMPSRVRAFLYNEKVEELVDDMSESLNYLSAMGCNKILLACNTSHLFLPQIYDRNPELKNNIINIISTCAEKVYRDNHNNIHLLATEGTIDSNIYHRELKNRGISCIAPKTEEYYKLRCCIEAVKQNNYSEEVREMFLELINRYDSCILGCTELPILYEKYKDDVLCKNIYDPIYISLNYIHNLFCQKEEF